MKKIFSAVMAVIGSMVTIIGFGIMNTETNKFSLFLKGAAIALVGVIVIFTIIFKSIDVEAYQCFYKDKNILDYPEIQNYLGIHGEIREGAFITKECMKTLSEECGFDILNDKNFRFIIKHIKKENAFRISRYIIADRSELAF